MKLKICFLYCLVLSTNFICSDSIDPMILEDFSNAWNAKNSNDQDYNDQDYKESENEEPGFLARLFNPDISELDKETRDLEKEISALEGLPEELQQKKDLKEFLQKKRQFLQQKKQLTELNKEIGVKPTKDDSIKMPSTKKDLEKAIYQQKLNIEDKKYVLDARKTLDASYQKENELAQKVTPEIREKIYDKQVPTNDIVTKEQADLLTKEHEATLRKLTHQSDIFSRAWNSTKDTISGLKDTVLEKLSDTKEFAQEHPWLAAVVATTAAVTGSGIINRLTNLAGWKYAKFRDYPHAKPGTYQIIITFEHAAAGKVLANPSVLLNFTNHQTIQAQNTFAIFNIEQYNKDFKLKIGNGRIDVVLSNLLLNLQDYFKNDQSIQMKIDVGIEDESGFFGSYFNTKIGSSFHTANRRWLKPIITTVPLDTFKHKDDALKYVADLFVAQLKDRISSAKNPTPNLKTMVNLKESNDPFLKQNYEFLKKHYDTENPILYISDKNGYEVAKGTWDMIQNDVAQYTENYPKLAQYNIALEFLPSDSTMPNSDTPLENSFYYLSNIKCNAENNATEIEKAIQLN